MFRVRTAGDVEDFVGLPGDPEDYAELVSGLWDSGASRPEWCFLLEDGSTRVGRIGFRVAPTVSDPAWLGSLPPQELFVYGLHLPWESEYMDAGRRLITEATAGISDEAPDLLEVRVNNSVHSHTEARRRLLTACGMHLFQEKIGFTWNDEGGEVDVGDGLRYRSISDVGFDAYRAVMAPCGEDTLDRNDRYYWTGCGPEGWAAQMTAYLEEEDAAMWLVGYRDGDPVGYVAVASVEDWGSTIVHVGVHPEHRGHGYIHDLLAAGTAAARQSGITTMLSDVDVLNTPMRKAMHRAGHIENHQRWHLWVYRTDAPREAR
jgi:ribosomal protein S18 acetylase RimI-like enzyme